MRSLIQPAVLVAAAFALTTAGAQATTRRHTVATAHARHLHVVRHRFAPAIPPFDQGEAEAEVHEIAPYRTYSYYPYPYRTPYPDPYTAW